jgi:putative kinase
MLSGQSQDPVGYPPEWADKTRNLVGQTTLNVAGYDVGISITAEQLDRVYLPLLALLADSAAGGHRVLAGLGGIPGSGKSTFAAALERVAGRLRASGWLAVVGLDGWHYPNAVLDQRTVCDELGQLVTLRSRKGGPQSFDVPAMAAAIESLQVTHRVVNLPAYDRRIHDPVPDAIAISSETQVVLIEGNFLLGTSPPWDRVSGLLKPRLFLEADPEAARERIIQRHIRGGAPPEQAMAKFETNDLLNIQAARQTAANADFVIRLDPPPHLRAHSSPPDASL